MKFDTGAGASKMASSMARPHVGVDASSTYVAGWEIRGRWAAGIFFERVASPVMSVVLINGPKGRDYSYVELYEIFRPTEIELYCPLWWMKSGREIAGPVKVKPKIWKRYILAVGM